MGERVSASQLAKDMLWPYRKLLLIRRSLSGTQEERGIPWYEYSAFSPSRYCEKNLIVFTLVATHQQFILRHGNEIFSQAATVVRLRENDLTQLLGLLGVLNSSTACFWLRQVCHDKGNRGEGGGITSDGWERFHEFTGTKFGAVSGSARTSSRIRPRFGFFGAAAKRRRAASGVCRRRTHAGTAGRGAGGKRARRGRGRLRSRKNWTGMCTGVTGCSMTRGWLG